MLHCWCHCLVAPTWLSVHNMVQMKPTIETNRVAKCHCSRDLKNFHVRMQFRNSFLASIEKLIVINPFGNVHTWQNIQFQLRQSDQSCMIHRTNSNHLLRLIAVQFSPRFVIFVALIGFRWSQFQCPFPKQIRRYVVRIGKIDLFVANCQLFQFVDYVERVKERVNVENFRFVFSVFFT